MRIKWQAQDEEENDRSEQDVQGARRLRRERTNRRSMRKRGTETAIGVDYSRNEDGCEENKKRFNAMESFC